MRAGIYRYLLAFWFTASVVNAQQIQYAEPLDLAVSDGAARFDAYGRRFSLKLADNGRALHKLSAQHKQSLQPYRLLRGTIDGQPGSWVRLTESAAGIEGAIWDGRELYAVTRHDRIAPLLSTPLAIGQHQAVVYRLSDTQDLLPRGFCALGGGAPGHQKQSGLDHYQELVGSLAALTPGTLESQLEIALVADSAFAAAESGDSVAAMLARFNIVEGIFSEQLGLLVLASDVRVLPASEDPFTSSHASTLLEQFAGYRAAHAELRGRALAHLMTGRKLDGTTAGIAYMDAACSTEHGASLSSRSFGTTISALIMAHELGHNLGAPHDGEAGACASVGGGYIMAPAVSGFTTFSSCSLGAMRAALAKSSCVAPAHYADVSLTTPDAKLRGEAGVPFTLPFTLSASGTLPAADVSVEVDLPVQDGVTLQALSAEGASCSVNGTRGLCQFGAVNPGESRSLSAVARSTQAGNLTARARVGAANDALASNNSRTVEVSLRSGVDAAVSVDTDFADVPLGSPLQVFTEVRSLRALPVRDAVLSLTLNQPVGSASMPGASCTSGTHGVICNIAEIPAGGSALLTVHTVTAAAGPLFAAASVSAPGDGEFANNTAHGKAWVQAARDVELSAGPARIDLAVGGWHEIPFLVRSRGSQATAEGMLEFTAASDAVAVDVVDAGGGSCAPDGETWRCTLGALAPGLTQLVRVRVQGLRAALVDVTALATAADDGYTGNNAVNVQLDVDNTVDLGLLFGAGGTGLEGEDVAGQVLLRSSGREAVTGASVEVALHAAGELRAVSIHDGADCELLTPQRARCLLPTLPRNAGLSIDYRARFEQPGTYDVAFRLDAPGDTQADNDLLTRPVVVRPYYDVAVVGNPSLDGFLVGEVREVSFEVRTGPRALASARFLARQGGDPTGVHVRAIRSSFGDCRVEADGGVCDFAELAAQSSVLVQVTLEALSACRQDLDVEVITTGDVLAGNNALTARINVLGSTDLELRVGESVRGAAGTTLPFPSISIVNGGAVAVGARLEVALPEGVTLVNLSASAAICSGTRVLRCDFADIEANGTATVNLSVRATGGGNYLSNLKLTALNDTNPGNDARQVALDIVAAAPAPQTAAKGGGGRLEWLLLAALAALKMGTFLISRAGLQPISRHQG